MNYRVLFLGYWNLDDALTHSTIFPHLKILMGFEKVKYLHFANTQREKPSMEGIKKVKTSGAYYTPMHSKNLRINHFNKIYDFIQFPKLIRRICHKNKINLIICRGAPSGSLAYLATRKNKIPFVVESFEPHADYMRVANEWRGYGIRYLFQKYWEKQQKKFAKYLITVTENYRKFLIEEGVEKNKIFCVPCAVDQSKFYKNENIKNEKRIELNIPSEATVGVYAGKFGGLYLEDNAFEIFRDAFNKIKDFHLLLLTNTDKDWLNNKIKKYNLPSNRIFVKFVSYNKVNNYLNIADFAFALYKSNHVSQFLSPVKIGEYWACGLPVLITQNIGDEMHWIEEMNLGDIISENNKIPISDFASFSRASIIKKGLILRDIKKVSQVYNQILN